MLLLRSEPVRCRPLVFLIYNTVDVLPPNLFSFSLYTSLSLSLLCIHYRPWLSFNTRPFDSFSLMTNTVISRHVGTPANFALPCAAKIRCARSQELMLVTFSAAMRMVSKAAKVAPITKTEGSAALTTPFARSFLVRPLAYAAFQMVKIARWTATAAMDSNARAVHARAFVLK
jgi:hypothetical protein